MKHDPFILRFHKAFPAVTSKALASWRDDQNHSSYDRLAALSEAVEEQGLIVDLGCGDGYLMERILERGPARLIGVDMSPDELDAARKRLGNRVELRREQAQATRLETNSVDLILSHMAIGAMRPVEPVFAEIARILKPGGRLRYTQNRGGFNDPAYDVFIKALRSLREEEGVSGWFLGDRRVYLPGGLGEILQRRPELEVDQSVEDYALEIYTTPRGLWRALGSFYDVALLSEWGQQRLFQTTEKGWRALMDDRGGLYCRLGMRTMGCIKR